MIQFAWLPLERHHAPVEPYLSGDGFDIYLDGCLFLPDSVTFSKVKLYSLDPFQCSIVLHWRFCCETDFSILQLFVSYI